MALLLPFAELDPARTATRAGVVASLACGVLGPPPAEGGRKSRAESDSRRPLGWHPGSYRRAPQLWEDRGRAVPDGPGRKRSWQRLRPTLRETTDPSCVE